MRRALVFAPCGSDAMMLARRLASNLPALTGQTLVEHAWITYGARLTDGPPRGEVRAPFRAPHHTVSEAGLCGSYQSASGRVYPGEVSLAHGGCLLLDQLPEFQASAIGALGLALRNGERRFWTRESFAIPARPALLLATAPLCPCGYLGSPHACRCDSAQIARWQDRIYRLASALGITEVTTARVFDLLGGAS